MNRAGVILDGTLLCGEHANEALELRRAELRSGNDGRGKPPEEQP